MAKIKFKIIGSFQLENFDRDGTVNVDDISEIIQQIELRFPRDHYFEYEVYLNNIRCNETSKTLHDGDEVIVWTCEDI